MTTNTESLSHALLESVTGGTVLLPDPKRQPPPVRCDPWSCEDMRRILEQLNKQPESSQLRPNRLPHGTPPGLPGQRRPNYR